MLETHSSTKVIIAFSFLVMVVVNVFAFFIPINHMTTLQILNFYPSLFAPAEYTFYIGLLIYLMLAGYTIYQSELFRKADSRLEDVFERVRILFMIATVLNASRTIALHYEFMALSLTMSIIIFTCLLVINHILHKEELSIWDKLAIKLPFSIFFGWITMITIITFVTLLVSIGWQGTQMSDLIGYLLILVVSTSIGLTIMFKYKNIAFGFIFIWAYIGILVKHISAAGYHGKYPEIIVTTLLCIIILAITTGYLFLTNKRKL